MKPAALQGRAFESGLVERILDDVGEEAGSLPLLEFALTKLWDGQKAGWLTHDAYEEIGRVEGAVARHADAVFDGLSEADQALGRKVIVQMVRPGEGTEDTRRVARRDELGDDGWTLVRKLADARLVVTDRDEAGRETAEVVHEALIRTWGQLKGWMSKDRHFRTWQERLRFSINQWMDSGQDAGALLRGVPLVEAELWLTERAPALIATEIGFIELSAEAEAGLRSARQRLQRQIRVALSSVAVVALIGLAVALVLGQSATRSAKTAQIEAKTAEARVLLLQDRSVEAIEGALSAMVLAGADPPPEVEAVLSEAAYRPGTRLVFTGHQPARVLDATLSPDGRHVLSGGSDGSVIYWERDTGKVIHRFQGEQQFVYATALSGDGRLALTAAGAASPGEQQTQITLWDVETARPLRNYGALGRITNRSLFGGVAFDREARRVIASSLADSVVWVWDLETGEELHKLEFPGAVMRVAVSPDGQWLAAGGTGSALVWDIDTGKLVGEQSLGPFDVAFSNDSRRLLLGGYSPRTYSLWDFESDEVVDSATTQAHINDVLGVGFTPDDEFVVTAGLDSTLSVWDASNGELIRKLFGHRNMIHSLDIGRDGVAVTGSSDGSIRVWDVVPPLRLAKLPAQTGQALNTSRQVILKQPGGRLQLWDPDSGGIDRLFGVEVGTDQISMSPDDALLAVGSGQTALYDLSTKTLRWQIPGPGWLRDIEFSPDGSLLAFPYNKRPGDTSNVGHVLRVVDVVSGRELRRFMHPGRGVGTSWSPDGRLLAVGQLNDPNDIYVWNVEDGTLVQRLRGHQSWARSVAFGVRNDRLYTGGADQEMRIWNLETGENERSISLDGNVRLESSKSRQHLIVWTTQGVAGIWDIERDAFVRRFGKGLFAGTTMSSDSGFAIGEGYLWRTHLSLDDLLEWTLAHRHFASPSCEAMADLIDVDRCRELRADGAAAYDAAAQIPQTESQPVADTLPLSMVDSELLPAEELRQRERGDIKGSRVAGTLSEGSFDRWQIDARAGELVTIRAAANTDVDESKSSTRGLESAAALDPQLVVRYPDGAVLIDNDNALGGLRRDAEIRDIEWPEDGTYLVDVSGVTGMGSGAYDLEVEVLPDRRLWTNEGHMGPVRAITMLPDGRRALSVAADKLARIWDLRFGGELSQVAVHITPTLALAVVPDGRIAISSAEDGSVAAWEVASGHVRWRRELDLLAHSLAVLPDGSSLVLGLEDGSIQLWDVVSGAFIRAIGGHAGFSAVHSLAVSPDGKRLLSGSGDAINADYVSGSSLETALLLWDLSEGTLVGFLDSHRATVTSVAFAPDGRLAASGGTDGQVVVWDTDTLELVWTNESHNLAVRQVAFIDGGKRLLVAGGHDDQLRVLDVATGASGTRLAAPRAAGAMALAVSADSRLAISGDETGAITTWTLAVEPGALDSAAAPLDGMAPLETVATPTAVPMGQVAAGIYSGSLRPGRFERWKVSVPDDGLLSVEVRAGIAEPQESTSRVGAPIPADSSLPEQPDQDASTRPSAMDPFVLVFDSMGNTLARQDDRLAGEDLDVLLDSVLVVDEDTLSVDVGGSQLGQIGIYTLTLGLARHMSFDTVLVEPFPWSTGALHSAVYGLSVAADGSRIASGGKNGRITLWDASAGEIMGRLGTADAGHTSPVRALAFSPDGRRLLSSATGEIILWDVESGKKIRQLEGHPEDEVIYGLAFHPDGRRAISGSDDGTAIIWETETGEILHKLEGHADSVHSVIFSLDGGRAYTASSDKLILVWDVETGEEVQRLEGHNHPVRRMDFTPDGRQLLSADNGWTGSVQEPGQLLLWNLESGSIIRRLEGHRNYIVGAAVSPDGRWGLSGSADKTARLWNLSTGEEVARLLGHEGTVREVAFMPDGTRAVTNSLDGTVRVWDLTEVIEALDAP